MAVGLEHSARLSKRAWRVVLIELFSRFRPPFHLENSHGPHIRAATHIDGLLATFLIASIPNLCIGLWNFGAQSFSLLAAGGAEVPLGWQARLVETVGFTLSADSLPACVLFALLYFLPLIATSFAVGIVWELVFARLRGRHTDPGWLMSSWLFVLLLPATLPPWYAALGLSFGTVLGKHVFGGTGKYIVSPALLGFVFLYVSYPMLFAAEALLPAGLANASTWESFVRLGSQEAAADGKFWTEIFMGRELSMLGTGSALGCAIGASILIYKGAASYRTVLGALVGLAAVSLLFDLSATPDPAWHIAWHWHAVLGGFAFGTVFIATDPTVSPVTATGRWSFGVLIGAMVVGMRTLNPEHPDSALLAILMASLLVPLIDHVVLRLHVKRFQKRRLR